MKYLYARNESYFSNQVATIYYYCTKSEAKKIDLFDHHKIDGRSKKAKAIFNDELKLDQADSNARDALEKVCH